MGFGSQVILVVAAVAVAFIGLRAGETLRFIGDENKPGIFDLFKNDHVRAKSQSIKEHIDSYDQKYARLANGVQEQDTEMVNSYYQLTTPMYEYGWSQSFHMAHLFGDEDHENSLKRHEHELADKVGIAASDKVIDVGCGVGGPARNIHLYTKADVTGVTISDYQIMRAELLTKSIGAQDKVHFKQMDFTKMSFDDNTFDRAYSIEATCHATDLYDVYREIFRVLKPNGIFGSYEWVTTKKYDPTNEEHKKIMHNIAYGSGLPPMHSFEDVLVAAKKAGFELVYEEDVALKTGYSKPWWHKLNISQVSTFITHYFTLFMEKLGFAQEGSTDAHTMLLHAIDGLVQGGLTGTFTPMHMVIFRKPAANVTPQN